MTRKFGQVGKWKYVGVAAVEFFEARDGRVLANEIAPRVHNTGRWTLETDASQFENHVRAVLGSPLRRPTAARPTAMVNNTWEKLRRAPPSRAGEAGQGLLVPQKRSAAQEEDGHVNIVTDDVEKAKEGTRKAL